MDVKKIRDLIEKCFEIKKALKSYKIMEQYRNPNFTAWQENLLDKYSQISAEIVKGVNFFDIPVKRFIDAINVFFKQKETDFYITYEKTDETTIGNNFPYIKSGDKNKDVLKSGIGKKVYEYSLIVYSKNDAKKYVLLKNIFNKESDAFSENNVINLFLDNIIKSPERVLLTVREEYNHKLYDMLDNKDFQDFLWQLLVKYHANKNQKNSDSLTV